MVHFGQDAFDVGRQVRCTLDALRRIDAQGSDADIVLIDPTIRKTLTKDDFHVADYSPWEGWQITGWPVLTILRGKVIAEKGKLLGSTSDGRLLTRKIDNAVLARPAV